MALTDLLRALKEDAAARAEALRADAARDAERVRADAAADLANRHAAALHQRERELRAAAARELETTRRAAATRHLEARAAALARIRGRVDTRLASRAEDPNLVPLVRRDLLRALDYAGEGDAVATTSCGMADALRASLGERPRLRIEGSPAVAGVVLRALDGAWSVDATFRSRLDRAWATLAIDIVRRLEADR